MTTDQEKKTQGGQARLIAETMLESELAQALGVPIATVKRLRHEGAIPYVQVAHGRVIYLVDSIIGWLKQKEFTENLFGTNKSHLQGTDNRVTIHEQGMDNAKEF
jgi:hypothetical protein